MIILQSIATLLMTVTVYLTSAIGTPQQQQAVDLANQAIAIAQQILQQEFNPPTATQENTSSSSISPQPATFPSGVSTTPIIPIVEPIIQQPISMKSITIISPIQIKGLGRTYLSRPNIKDEFNYIELGLIVRDDSGKPIDNAIVTVTATDNSQNRTINGTGDVTPIYENNVKMITPYYHFSYEFKYPGEHTITFSAEGLTQSVILSVTEDTRPE